MQQELSVGGCRLNLAGWGSRFDWGWLGGAQAACRHEKYGAKLKRSRGGCVSKFIIIIINNNNNIELLLYFKDCVEDGDPNRESTWPKFTE